MTASRRLSSTWIYLSFFLILAGLAITYLGYRSQARLAMRVQEQARERGLTVTVGTAEPGVLSATFHDVKLRFRDAPGVSATLSRVSLLGAFFGSPEVAVDEVHFVLTGEPTAIYKSLLALPDWNGVPLSIQQVSAEYPQPLLGKVTFDRVKLERSGPSFVIRVANIQFAGATSRDVRLSLGKRNELIELGIGEPDGPTSPAQLGYFGSSHGAAQWMLSVRHQPVRPLTRALGWELDSSFDESRAVVSGSVIIPDDRSRPTRSTLEFALDQWPKPAWPDAAALLGETAAFVAAFPLPAPGARWDLQRVTLSLSLFTLTGTGQVLWGDKPSVSLELSGKLTCAQLRGNLPPSVYLERVNKYLAPEPVLDAASAAARLREEVELRLRLVLEKESGGKHEALWRLAAGCGMPALGEP
jgi:hypothetical protein